MNKTFNISNNIGKDEIDQFVNFYIEELNKCPDRNCEYKIDIFFESSVNEETGEINEEEKGYIDPIFLSYISLFIIDFHNTKVNFIFKYFGDEDSKNEFNRIFSIRAQLSHLILLPNVINSISLITHNINDSKISEYDLTKELTHSQKFIPPVFINKDDVNSIHKYFKAISENEFIDKYLDELIHNYYNKIIEVVKEKTFENKERANKSTNEIIEQKLELSNLSFIELTILLLLINDESFQKLGGKGITKKIRIERKKENFDKIVYYSKYVKEISKGLKELANNIYQHSEHNGIITARVFKKETLINLKGNDSVENDYIKLVNEQNKLFLDINVIDFGPHTVKNKYIKNLIYNKNKATIYGLSREEIQGDIDIINRFDYKDFFIINESFFQLKHQQNKLISRYGLHHFSTIILDELDGFIKTSSQNEKAIIYKDNKNKNLEILIDRINTFFPKRGTFYNCIVPLKEKPKQIDLNNEIIEENYIDAIDSLIKIKDYQICYLEENICDKNKTTIYKYPLPKTKQILLTELNKIDVNDKYKYISYLFEDIKKKGKNKENEILLLNADDIFIDDASDWIRLLSVLNTVFKDIIIYNTKKDVIKELKDIREKYEKIYNSEKKSNIDYEYQFWSDNSRVLFYSKKIDPVTEKDLNKTYYRYGATMLMGKTVKNYNYINKSIWKHRYSFGTKEGFFSTDNQEVSNENITYGDKLFSNKILNYFELLIKTENNLTLFEQSVQYSLNKYYLEYDKNTNNTGYRIHNTHFRLGSKIHISDFYYAKRLFQNSFFTTPLAFLMSKYICDNNIISNRPITIIGYESYSDFIASSVRNILKKWNPDLKIRNAIITKDGKFSREYEKIHSNFIIIVPIASTFTTSIKIKKDIDNIITKFNDTYFSKIKDVIIKDGNLEKNEINSFIDNLKNNITYNEKAKIDISKIEIPGNIKKEDKEEIINEIKKIKPNPNILSYLNVLLVGNKYEIKEEGKVKNISYFDDISNNGDKIISFSNGIFNDFNWKSINIEQKIIEVEPFSEKEPITKQKYFIPLYSPWHKAENCQLCFPKEITKERCLIETNPASVTPQVIFDYPKIRTNLSGQVTHGIPPLDYTKSLFYGNIKRNHNRHLFYIRTGQIISDNSANIINWLEHLKKEIFKNKRNTKIVIVTPESLSKSNFINLVNEYIFNNTANSIVISLDEDYMENSRSLYYDALYKAETVIYVDDMIITGRSYWKISNIIKYIRNIEEEKEDILGIDYCVTLINRTLYQTEKNIVQDLKNKENGFYYLSKISFPSIEEPDTVFPLKKEKKKFKFLAKISSLDAVRQRYNDKINKLRLIDINKLSEYDNKIRERIIDKKHYKNKKTFQLLVLDALYSIFTFEQGGYKFNFESIFLSDFTSVTDIKQIEQGFSELTNKVKNRLNRYKKDHEHYKIIDKYETNIKCTILKVLTGTPLIYYKDLRENSYKWIYSELIKISEKISEIYKNKDADNNQSLIESLFIKGKDNYSVFDKFKLLLKRSVLLQGNFIIRKDFFELIKKVLIIIDKFNGYKSITTTQKEIDLFTQTKPKSTPITSKKFIYYVISLIQELLYEHETKAVILEEILNEEIGKIKDYDLNIENGNYAHFLRLLKLENTELFYKLFSYYLNDKTKYPTDKKIIDYQDDPKYKIVAKLIKSIKEKEKQNQLINKFIELSEELEKSKKENKSSEKDVEGFVRNTLLKTINEILNEEDSNNIIESYLIINNNKSININNKELYIFSDDNKIDINQENISNSIIYKMLKGIKQKNIGSEDEEDKKDDEIEISNLEIYKANNSINYRKDIDLLQNDENINDFIEFNYLENNGIDEYNILLIRISDFIKENNNQKLYTQGVIMVISNKGKRFNEDSLRLLLLLRHSISKFLKKGISEKVFSEIKKYEEREKLLAMNKHYLESFFVELKDIHTELNEGDDIIFNSIHSAIYNKIFRYRKKNIGTPSDYTINDIIKFIKTVFENNIFYNYTLNNKLYKITSNNSSDSINIPSIIIDNILLQLLINIKQYTDAKIIPSTNQIPLIKINIKMFNDRLELTLINKRDKVSINDRKNRQKKSGGISLINEIVNVINQQKEYEILYKNQVKCNNIFYITEIIIKIM